MKVKIKPLVAFVCTHNSCRSQIAEALSKKYKAEIFRSCSAGTEIKDHINKDAVRLIKKRYGIDIEETQRSKLITEIEKPDIVIFMGCDVKCPSLKSDYSEDWKLDDPTGKNDCEFNKVIYEIEIKLKDLAERIEYGL